MTDGRGLQAWRDEHDHYYAGGRRIHLLRSSQEFAVRFTAGVSRQRRQNLLQSVTPSAEVFMAAPVRAGRLYVVKGAAAAGPGELEAAMGQMRARLDVAYAFPVFMHAGSGARLIPTDEVVLKLVPGASIDEWLALNATYGLTVVERKWERQYVLRLRDPAAVDPLAVANALAGSDLVEWAEPNFIQEFKLELAPDDPLYPYQWHLENWGAGGGITDADVDASAAWDLGQGSPNTVIAILDDGVELGHEDLAANIFTNAKEVPANGIDDDGNGYVDDVHGWDFANNDNDPNPFLSGTAEDSHGTAVAGVAAARGSNATGVSGMCPTCSILPVKIGNSTSDGRFFGVGIDEAIRYAADHADVLNMSFGTAPSSQIQAAIEYAAAQGRGGKGAVVLAASGNSAQGYSWYGLRGFPGGTHRFRWEYSKKAGNSAGDDTAWLGWVRFPGGALVDFEGGLPLGWVTGGDADWTIVADPVHADEGACYTRAARAGAILDRQSSYIEAIRTVSPGELDFYAWPSSEPNDGLVLKLDLYNDNANDQFDYTFFFISGVPPVQFDVGFPASVPEAIAVGASSDADCRSGYSQFGSALDFVAPSSAGPLNGRVTTTDRTGAEGYVPTTYSDGFGGTSSATPLAAGIAGLMLAINPALTATQVRQIMRNTADKVGLEPYASGRNQRYGYGRTNARQALAAVPPLVRVRGDLNGDGRTDVLVRKDNLLSYVEADGSPSFFGALDPTWVVAGVGHFDDDRFADVLIRSGNFLSYLEKDSSPTFIAFLDPAWKVAGVGDLDGDGAAEILVRQGNLLSYLETDKAVTFIAGLNLSWSVAGVGDLDGDGAAEILVRKDNWLSFLETDGSAIPIGGLDLSWSVEGIGDLDGDDAEEILVRNDNWLSYLDTDGSATSIGRLEQAWVVEGLGYCNADGLADVLVRNIDLLSYVQADHAATFIARLDPGWVIQTD